MKFQIESASLFSFIFSIAFSIRGKKERTFLSVRKNVLNVFKSFNKVSSDSVTPNTPIDMRFRKLEINSDRLRDEINYCHSSYLSATFYSKGC